MITNTSQSAVWIEGGYITVGDTAWVTVSTVLSSFRNAAVFLSLPNIPGKTSSEGFPAIARIRNVKQNERVSFEVKIFLANDSYCSKNWYIPKTIDPPLS